MVDFRSVLFGCLVGTAAFAWGEARLAHRGADVPSLDQPNELNTWMPMPAGCGGAPAAAPPTTFVVNCSEGYAVCAATKNDVGTYVQCRSAVDKACLMGDGGYEE